MRITRAFLTALALLALLAVPAFAQGGADGDITISVSCTGNPEEVTVTNNLDDLPISIVEISSIDDPRENEPFFIGEEIGPGESITFESGDAADDNVLTEQFIFDDENLENEGVIVRIGPEPILDDFVVECNQSPETFEVLDGDDQQDDQDDEQVDDQQDEDMPDDMPETGAGGMSPTPFPATQALAGLSLVAAAAYAGIRRR